MQIKIQEKSFTMDFFLLELVGCDVVLGVQWLQTLGTISWNFKKLTMQFNHLEQEVLL